MNDLSDLATLNMPKRETVLKDKKTRRLVGIFKVAKSATGQEIHCF